MIEKGQLSLEDKISKYVDNLPKEWQDVKIKNLLSHSSGIPDFERNNLPTNLSNAQVFERLSKEKRELENQETASKILDFYNSIKPYLKFIIPIYVISFCVCLFLFDKFIISLLFLSPIGALIWAFFSKPK